MSSRNYGRSPSPRRRSPRPNEYRESRRRSPPNPYYPGSSSSSYDTRRSPRALSPIPLRVGPSRHSPPPRRGMSPIPLHIPSLKTDDYRGTSRLSPPGAQRGYSPPRSLLSGHAYPAPGRRSPPTPPTRGYPSTKSPQMSGGVRRGYSPLPTDSLKVSISSTFYTYEFFLQMSVSEAFSSYTYVEKGAKTDIRTKNLYV
jgi:hypothetical protein